MRVGIDAHTLQGRYQGIRTHVAHLARAIVETAGPDDEVVLLGCNRVEAAAYVRGENWWTRPWRVPTPWLRIPFEVPIREITLRLSVFHSQYICPPLSPVPEVVSIHDILFETNPEWFPQSFVRRNRILYRLSARRASLVVTGSHTAKESIVAQYGVDADKIVVIPHGADHVLTAEPREHAWKELRRRLPDRFHLFVGRIDPRKNLERLAQAYRLRWERGKRTPLVLVGVRDFGNERTMAALAKDLAAGRILEMGQLDDDLVAALYRNAEVVVYPTLGEGFGLPVLEAMAAGSAVVTSPDPAIREFADGCVLFADPSSPESIAAQINVAEEGGEAIQSMKAAAVKRASRFTWRQTAACFWDVYRCAARGSRTATQ